LVATGQDPTQLELSKVLSGRGREKIKRQIQQRFLQEAREQAGVKRLSKLGRSLALGAARETFQERMESPLSIADLGTLEGATLKAGDLKKGFRVGARKEGLLIGKQFTSTAAIEQKFELTPTEGGTATTLPSPGQPLPGTAGAPPLPGAVVPGPPLGGDVAPEPGTIPGALSALEEGAIDLMLSGSALMGGDFTSPFAQDFLTVFNEAVRSPLALRGGARSGGAAFASSIGGRTALMDIGQKQALQGLELLGATSPTELPQNVLGILGQKRQQDLFNQLLNLQLRQAGSAERQLLQGFGNMFEQTFTPTLAAGAGQSLTPGGLLSSLGGTLGAAKGGYERARKEGILGFI
jgi:hypothetical protein